MIETIRVALKQRAVVFRNGLPTRVLGPGKHRVWGFGITSCSFDTTELLVDAPAAVRRLLEEAGWIEEVTIGRRQRGVLLAGGVPVRFLRPGTHRYWVIEPDVTLQVLEIDAPVPELSDELAALIPHDELVDVIVNQHQRGLLYVQGKFERMLQPGRYSFWSHREAKVVVKLLDMRQQQLVVAGQDLMTRDKVTLRLTLVAEYAPADPPTVVHAVDNPANVLYTLVQLAARDYVAGVTLDELLEGRGTMTEYLIAQVAPQAAEIGVDVRQLGVRDVVLPGDMKALLNRVIEAEKEAAANVIARREEAAATRQMANTAKIMTDNPVLLELKQLETVKEIAANIGEVKLLVGDGGLRSLLGGKLLGGKSE